MPEDDEHVDQKPLRLGRQDEVRPLRLEAAVRRLAPRPEPLSPPPRWDGAALRSAREAAGISLAQLSERTKVTRHHLENIEAARVERLPARAYLRGFLMAIAKELRLDPQQVTRSYLDAVFPPPPPVGEGGPATR